VFQQEKSVERNANAVAAGRVAGVDPIEQITKRCIRIFKTPEVDFGGCALCRFSVTILAFKSCYILDYLLFSSSHNVLCVYKKKN
jgi:hypothetical protein